MSFIAWDRLQWLPTLWGVVGAIAFLLIPLSHELPLGASVSFVSVGSGLLYFIVKVPLTCESQASPRADGRELSLNCIE